MIYVMSDIHGKLNMFKQMLKKIRFSDNDTLYLLGDYVDRGEEPIETVQFIKSKKNFMPIAGNHDLMAYTLLSAYDVINVQDYDTQLEIKDRISFWLNRNGGETTFSAYKLLSSGEKDEFLGFLHDLPLYRELDVGKTHYILVHAGIPHYTPDTPLSRYTADELVWTRPNFDEYLGRKNLRIIVGHTPTLSVNGKAAIYRGKSYVNIDCGACYGTYSGKLACLCLDTDEEFYVDNDD